MRLYSGPVSIGHDIPYASVYSCCDDAAQRDAVSGMDIDRNARKSIPMVIVVSRRVLALV